MVIIGLQREQELIANSNNELMDMLFIQWKDKLISGVEQPSLEES